MTNVGDMIALLQVIMMRRLLETINERVELNKFFDLF